MADTKKRRLSAEARKEAILSAVLPLFAEKGLSGVSTRELAKACDVSEALIFRYFPTKEALFEEILTRYEHRIEPVVVRLARKLEPGTGALVQLVFMFIRLVVIHEPSLGDPTVRLFYRSFTEDGVFARRFLKRWVPPIKRFFDDSLNVAQECGDVRLPDIPAENLFHFVQHLASASGLVRLQSPPVVRYRGRIDSVAVQMTRFALTGLGMKEAAIQRYLTEEAMTVWVELEQQAL
ncbi:TetR/AcrR family transcriptional regulator [Coraliomargarita parva]|uniref:TetR/AcrR family transcriptional regulator n=1 Tax=Coraliomargarita parva TaxID=3014050 RepID=UPI0022B34A2C|nr:TetR/AcrR family transcriptional regulator [Coraliomargarita parva]